MRTRKPCAAAVAIWLALLPACTADNSAQRSPLAEFRFNPSARHQIIEGWGGLLANWHWADGASGPSTPIADDLEQNLLREIVFDLGLNRFGLNFPARLIEPVNDNNDPHTLNESAFDFSKMEPYIREQLLPLRDLLRQRGERFVFYSSVILYQPQPGSRGAPRFLAENPEEYVEFCLAALHFLRGFGLEPDYWVTVNEPDLVRLWTPAQLAERVVLLGRRMREARFATRISAPETVQPAGVSAWLSAIAATPEARQYLGAISYHSYDYDPTDGQRPPIAPRASIANWGRLLHLPIAQTEQGQAGKKNAHARWNGLQHEHTLDIAENIFADLLHANTSAWQLHVVIGWGNIGSPGTGGAFISARRDGSGFDVPAHYWGMWHFSRFVRPGAVRVGLQAAQQHSPVLAAAFLTPAGQPVVVAMNRSKHQKELHLTGLPAGSYSVSLTTRDEKAAERQLAPLAAGQPLRFTLPAESVATLFVR